MAKIKTKQTLLFLHFPCRTGLAHTRMSPFWILTALRVLEVVVTTGAGVVKYLNTQVFKYYLNTVTGIWKWYLNTP